MISWPRRQAGAAEQDVGFTFASPVFSVVGEQSRKKRIISYAIDDLGTRLWEMRTDHPNGLSYHFRRFTAIET